GLGLPQDRLRDRHVRGPWLGGAAQGDARARRGPPDLRDRAPGTGRRARALLEEEQHAALGAGHLDRDVEDLPEDRVDVAERVDHLRDLEERLELALGGEEL